MPNYRRVLIPGATYFFTVVTGRRKPILASPDAVQTLRESVAVVRHAMPFAMEAWVVLPDHMHAIWTLPDGDADYPRRWGRIKAEFTRRCGIAHASAPSCDSGVWQPRFWEHLIRNEDDATAHMNYLHFNPVKHGLAARVSDWPYSSFHRHVREGRYPLDWGGREPIAPQTAIGE
jgi:putative transposase